MATTTCVPDTAGIGLRLPHLEEAVVSPMSLGWLEIHPENFIANPHATELLVELSKRYPISVHTVGLSVGSATGVDHRHLARVKTLIQAVNPVLVSGHLAWSTHKSEYLNDLLPLPYDEQTLQLVASQLLEVQDALGRSFLLENPSSYVGFAGSTMTEVQFLGELVARTGARLLCDVSNVYVSGHNMGYDPVAYFDAFPASAVAELHLGGFTPEPDNARPGEEILIDTHAERVNAPSWDLYAHAVRRFGVVPTLIEWDAEIPSLSTLVEEAQRADRVARGMSGEVTDVAR